jgi:hypothetical protein
LSYFKKIIKYTLYAQVCTKCINQAAPVREAELKSLLAKHEHELLGMENRHTTEMMKLINERTRLEKKLAVAVGALKVIAKGGNTGGWDTDCELYEEIAKNALEPR